MNQCDQRRYLLVFQYGVPKALVTNLALHYSQYSTNSNFHSNIFSSRKMSGNNRRRVEFM